MQTLFCLKLPLPISKSFKQPKHTGTHCSPKSLVNSSCISPTSLILVMLILCFKYKLATITSKSCQQHNQPTCICYFSSINPIDPFGQVARTCWHSSKFGRHAFICCAPSVWNKLPLSVRSLNSFNSFKSHLKTHLFAHYKYPLSSYHLATACNSDSSLALDNCACFQVFVCMYVCTTVL